MKTDAMTETLKASPPVSVLGAWVAGFTINEWAAAAALLYTLFLIGEKFFAWYKAWKLKA